MAGESGPGPNENDEEVGPRDGYRRITSNLPRSHEGHAAPELREFVDPKDVRTDAEHAHSDADRAKDARGLIQRALALKYTVKRAFGQICCSRHRDRYERDLRRSNQKPLAIEAAESPS